MNGRSADVLKRLTDLNTRRTFSSITCAGVAAYCGLQAGYGGVVAVVLAFAAGIAFVLLNPAFLHPPEPDGSEHEWAAAAGATTGLILANTASAMNLPTLSFVVVGLCLAFFAGLIWGLRMIRYPDAPS